MYILIPVEEENGLESTISTLANMKKWALVDLASEDGHEPKFYDDWQATDADFIDHIILDNHKEDAMDFINEGIFCLVRRDEKKIDELISAFQFRELDEMSL